MSSVRYSRFITVIKVILPLIAIGLLSTVFLFSSDDSIEGGFKFSAVDLESLESGLRVVEPRIFGSNADGDVYNFNAEMMLPDSLEPSLVEVQKISGKIEYHTGVDIYISSDKAEFLIESKNIELSGGMRIESSDGMVITGEGLIAELEEGELTSTSAVEVTSPLGRIQAGKFRLVHFGQEDEENQMIWFENGVMLSFKPEAWKDKGANTE